MTENFTDLERDIFGKLLENVMENAIRNCNE